jgi:hypothetical protein
VLLGVPGICSKESVIVFKVKPWVGCVMNRFFVFIIDPLLFWFIFNVLFNNNVSPGSIVLFGGQNVVDLSGLVGMEHEASVWLHSGGDWLGFSWGNIRDDIAVKDFNLKSDI